MIMAATQHPLIDTQILTDTGQTTTGMAANPRYRGNLLNDTNGTLTNVIDKFWRCKGRTEINLILSNWIVDV
jgi:hypothetical protein